MGNINPPKLEKMLKAALLVMFLIFRFLLLPALPADLESEPLFLHTEREPVLLQFFPTLFLFDEYGGVPLGPLDRSWDGLWEGSVRLKEDFQLEDIIRELENTVIIKTHIVQPGENLWDISRMYDIDVATLAGANHDIENVHQIKPGQELRVLSIRGTVHIVEKGDTLSELSAKYQVESEDILRINDIDPDNLQAGQEIIIPGAQPLDYVDRGGSLDSFIWPVRGGWISSPYGVRWGKMHEGIDIAVSTGTPVHAVKNGWVRFSGWNGAYGNVVDINHGDGVLTRYAHNDAILVKNGQFVYQGQVIARSGNTGISTGPHLHFEIRLNNKPMNPILYLPPR